MTPHSTAWPMRQIHLDFHTSPHIPGIGAEFDADAFAEQMVAARVNSVTVFAKCHHGHLYYDTAHPARHPHLRRNLLAEQIDALHRRGIRAPIYLSVQVDELAASLHPDWVTLSPEGKPFGPAPFERPFFTWNVLDMSSPYLDYLEEQIREVLRLFKPVDGLFFDMCWDQETVSKWAIDGMRRAGLDPTVSADRQKYANHVSLGYMERFTRLIAAEQADVPVAFNSRPLAGLPVEKKYLRHVEIEALATGAWGYLYFPLQVRFVRPFGLPMIGMTGRFHKSWGDFGGLKPEAALLYECAQSLAHGAGCSIGDQMHPRGTLDRASYETIGKVYRHVEACEPFCRDTEAPREIAVLHHSEGYFLKKGDACEGVVRALRELGCQFAFLAPDADWSGYRVVVVPEGVPVTAEVERRLAEFERAGGGVLREDLAGEPSAFTTTYLRLEPAVRGSFPATDHVFYERGVRRLAEPGEEVLARIVAPYFERSWEHFCSHCQTPPNDVSDAVAAGQRGRTIRLSLPVFRAYATHGNLVCRHLIGQCLARLLPDPVLAWKAPSFAEAVVSLQPGRTIVHLLLFSPRRRGVDFETIEEVSVARDVRIGLRCERAPAAVRLPLEDRALDFEWEAGRAWVTLPVAEGHQVLVFESSQP